MSDLRQKMLDDFIKKRRGSDPVTEVKEVISKEPEVIEPVECPAGMVSLESLIGHKDPTPKKPVFVKIYNEEDWDVSVRGHIPDANPNYVYTDLFFDITRSITMGLSTCLVGSPGTGKDEAPRQLAAITRMPYFRMTGMRNITPDMIIGRRTIKDGAVVWESGDAELVSRYGGLLVLSEPAAFAPDTFFAFQSVLESQNAFLSMVDHPNPKDRMLKLNPNTRIVLTSNTRGYGDDVDKYSATGVMDASTLNRIEVTIEVPYLEVAKEIELLTRNTGIPTEQASQIVRFGGHLRNAWNTGTIEASWSPRNMLAWAKMYLATGSLARGFTSTFLGRLSPTEHGVVSKLWRDLGLPESI